MPKKAQKLKRKTRAQKLAEKHAVMAKQKAYKLRPVIMNQLTLVVRDRFGNHVDIRVRTPRKKEKIKLFRAFQILEERLPEIVLPRDDLEISREMVMHSAQHYCGFLVTSNRHVVAYSSMDRSFPVIIINKGLFDRRDYDEKEFAVTVLHELMHWFFVDQDKASDSKDEARHDLWCYELLGLEIPSDHWALPGSEGQK